MFDILTKYQASLFLKSSEILPSPDIISPLLNMFRDKGFLPTTFQEIDSVHPSLQVRLRLNSSNNEWGINFGSDRIYIEKNPVATAGKNMGDVNDFADEVTDFIGRILNHFNKKGYRLSIITAGMLREMSYDQLDSIHKKIFRPLPFYKETLPFEWNSRSASQSAINIENHDEKINVITSINRVRGQSIEPNLVMKLDRIEVAFDINTLSEENTDRFSVKSLKEFFKGALTVRDAIIEQIKEMING
jgi:hypothetical protein